MQPETNTPDRLVPLSEARDHLGIGQTKLFKLVKDGDLNAVKLGRRTLIPQSELVRFQSGLRSARTFGGLR